jgi:hypothetical protein
MGRGAGVGEANTEKAEHQRLPGGPHARRVYAERVVGHDVGQIEPQALPPVALRLVAQAHAGGDGGVDARREAAAVGR